VEETVVVLGHGEEVRPGRVHGGGRSFLGGRRSGAQAYQHKCVLHGGSGLSCARYVHLPHSRR
jgi:hypothetical protein